MPEATDEGIVALDALSDVDLDCLSEIGKEDGGEDMEASASDADLRDNFSDIDRNGGGLDLVPVADDGGESDLDFLDALSDAGEGNPEQENCEDCGEVDVQPPSAIVLAENARVFAHQATRRSGDIEVVESSGDEAALPRPGSIAYARSFRHQERAISAPSDTPTEEVSTGRKADADGVMSLWTDKAMPLWQTVGKTSRMMLRILAEDPGAKADDEYHKDVNAITANHLRRCDAPRHLGGLRAEMAASRHGCTQDVYKARKNEVAEISLLASRLFLAAFFRMLLETKKLMPTKFAIELVHFLTFSDETPVKFRVREVVGNAGSEAISAAAPAGPLRATDTFERRASTQIAKLVQAELRVSILTRSTDDEGHDHFNHYSAELPCPLSSFDHNTADNLWAWYKNLLDIPGFSQEVLETSVERVAATTVMDLAASNSRMINFARHAEKNLDGKGWRRLQFCCQIHRVQTSQGHVYDIVSLHISAMIALALSLTHSGTFGKLKRALGWVMTMALEWHGPDEPPPDDMDERCVQRQALLDACIPEPDGEKDDVQSAERQKRLAVYNIIFNGDVSLPGRIQHFCRLGCCKDKEDTMRKLRGHGVWCLLPRCPHPFPVHRWTGSDEVVQCLTLLANTHGLLMMVVPLWTKLAKANNDYRTSESVRKFVEEELPGLVTDSDTDSDLSEGQVAGQPKRAWGGRLHGGKAKRTQDDVSTDWSKKARRHRAEVKSWARKHPDVPLMVILRAIQPGASLTYSLLKRAGGFWDAQRGLECLESGRMTFRLLQEHDCQTFEKYFERMCNLFVDETAWDLIPTRRMSMESRALAFRLLGRSVATIFILVALPCKGYPHKLFALLGDDPAAIAAIILADPDCLYCDFTIEFVAEFDAVEKLSSALALQLLMAIAKDVRDEIARIESRNAQLSHASRLRSGHMTPAEVPDMGAGFFLQRVRAAYAENYIASGKNADEKSERKPPGPRPVLKRPAAARSHRQGPFRAYLTEISESKAVSSSSFGSDFTIQAVASYRSLSPAERSRLRLVGDSTRQQQLNAATPVGAAAQADESADPLAEAVRAFLAEPAPESADAPDADIPALAIVPRDLDLDSAQLQIVRRCKASGAAMRVQRDAATARLAEHSLSEQALAPVTEQQRGLAALFAKPVDKRFLRTGIFELVPPLADFVDALLERVGPPKFDLAMHSLFGKGSFHEAVRTSWARRHGTWRHSEREKLPTKVPKSKGNSSICRAYGMCICDLPDLRLFLQKFTALLKSLHGKGSKWAACCDGGGCVIEFREVAASFDVLRRQHCHLAYVNHSSWAVGLLGLEKSRDRFCINAADAFGNEALRFAPDHLLDSAPDLFMAMGIGNAPLIFATFDLDQRIQLRMHEVVGGKRLAPVKKAGELEVKWIGGELAFWQGATLEQIAAAAAPPAPAIPIPDPGPAAPGPAEDGGAEPDVAIPIVDGDPSVEEIAADWVVALEAQLDLFAAEQVPVLGDSLWSLSDCPFPFRS